MDGRIVRVVILFINFYTTDAFGMNTISIYIYKNVNVRLLHIKDLGEFSTNRFEILTQCWVPVQEGLYIG